MTQIQKTDIRTVKVLVSQERQVTFYFCWYSRSRFVYHKDSPYDDNYCV